MTAATIIERTREYIRENFLYAQPDARLEADDALLERGIIDSMGVTELVQFLEEAFGIAVVDDEITEQNLGSLEAIAAFVLSKLDDTRVA